MIEFDYNLDNYIKNSQSENSASEIVSSIGNTSNKENKNLLADIKEIINKIPDNNKFAEELTEEIITDIVAVLVTHTHVDHWDEYTSKYIPKDIPIFVQNSWDKKLIVDQGFKDVRVLGINVPFKGITLTKTGVNTEMILF